MDYHIEFQVYADKIIKTAAITDYTEFKKLLKQPGVYITYTDSPIWRPKPTRDYIHGNPYGFYGYPISFINNDDYAGGGDFATERAYILAWKFDGNLLDVNKDSSIWFKTRSTDPVKWAKALRNLGYDGAIDNGGGIMDENPKSQIVALDWTKIRQIGVFKNPKYGSGQHYNSYDADGPRAQQQKAYDAWTQGKPIDVVNFLKRHQFLHFNPEDMLESLSEQELLQLKNHSDKNLQRQVRYLLEEFNEG